MSMKVTKELARELSEEMLAYELRMSEIRKVLDGDHAHAHSSRMAIKASALAEEAEHMIFSTRNVLCVAYGVKLTHKYPRVEESDNEQKNQDS
jgi:hypothetical protein